MSDSNHGGNKAIPPKLFLRFFRWYCHPWLTDHIEGDLIEVYRKRVQKNGKRKADIRFVIDVLLLFRPGIIRPAEGYKNLNNYGMYKSYFKIGWRNLVKNKGYSFINIGGLAMGMAVAMLISLWIYNEVSFNKYHSNYKRLAQVLQHQTFNGVKGTMPAIPRPLENALQNNYASDFKYLSMASWTGDHILSFGEQKISKSGNFVQPDFPEMLSLKMLKGSRNGLKDPTSIFLSESTATGLFGGEDPINKSMRIDNKMDVKVTGVYEDLPYNTSHNELKFLACWDLYLTTESWVKEAADQWGNNSFQLFIQLAPQSDFAVVSEKIKNIKAINAKDEAQFHPEIFLHPMRDWHLRSAWKEGINIGGRIQIVWLFGIICVFVLFLACINFMNLSTARSEKRAKEVGIRMTIGSLRSQLINQFLCESFLVTIFAFVLAIGIVAISLPCFNELADKRMIIMWLDPFFWLISVMFIISTSLLAGAYPALYLSAFQPVKVLKGALKTRRFASLPRKVLVVIQFTVSVTLIIGTIIVHNQIEFTKDRPIGYSPQGLVMMQMKSPDFYGKYDVLRSELKGSGAIEEMAESSSPITGVWSSDGHFQWEGKDPALQAEFALIRITHEYGKTVGWEVKEGRDLSREFSTDSSAIILNEAAIKFMNVKEPMGMEIVWNEKKFHVIGVVKDMIMESPYSPVRQTVYLLNYEHMNWIDLKLNPAKSASESIALIETVFKKHIPGASFEYKFVDQEYAKKFDAEERVGKLASVFAGLAILISCLGIFGLASFIAEQRTKEIGIRKIVGASVFNLCKMLSKDFVVLVVISSLISIPISYYLLAAWLKNYEYRAEISWWIFALTFIFALVITLLTVTYQAVKAAMMNPVKSLRSE